MKTIKKEKVIEIIEWAEEQGHIKGEIETLIKAIIEYEDE